MLSCTVENRDKRTQLEHYYTSIGRKQEFIKIDSIFQEQAALQEVITVLEAYRKAGKLNNANIARMVRNYFYEMSGSNGKRQCPVCWRRGACRSYFI